MRVQALPLPVLLALLLAGFAVFGAACSTPDPNRDQPWYRTFGDAATDAGGGIALAPNGDLFVATHETHPDVTPDAYVYRMTRDGSEILWTTQYSGAGGSSEQVFVLREIDDVVYVAGTSNDDALLFALEAGDGSFLWDYTYDQSGGYEDIRGIAVTSNGIYFAGSTTAAITSNDVLVGRVDLAGSEVWVNSFGTNNWDEANGHILTDQNYVYIVGRHNGTDATVGGDALLAAFDRVDGALIWDVQWGGPLETDSALSLATDGTRMYVASVTGSPSDVQVRQFDFVGTEIWSNTWGEAGSTQSAGAIKVDAVDGSLLLTANTDGTGAAGGQDIAVLRFDSGTGDLLDEALFGGAGDDKAHDIVLDVNHGFAAAQTESLGAGGTDAIVLSFKHRPLELPQITP